MSDPNHWSSWKEEDERYVRPDDYWKNHDPTKEYLLKHLPKDWEGPNVDAEMRLFYEKQWYDYLRSLHGLQESRRIAVEESEALST